MIIFPADNVHNWAKHILLLATRWSKCILYIYIYIGFVMLAWDVRYLKADQWKYI